MTPDTIMIFAAGHGTRMRALTATRPKPLISVAGRPLIDRALSLADDAGIPRKVVNTHYLGHQLAEHLQGRTDVQVSEEEHEALETGGGMKHALPMLGDGPIFSLNPDVVWTGPNALSALARNWQADIMGALLMLVPLECATGHKGRGDFTLDKSGRLTRFTSGAGPAFIYACAQIIHTDAVQSIHASRFSLNVVWDKLIAERRLFGCVHSGGWVDVGTPEGIVLAEDMLKAAGNV